MFYVHHTVIRIQCKQSDLKHSALGNGNQKICSRKDIKTYTRQSSIKCQEILGPDFINVGRVFIVCASVGYDLISWRISVVKVWLCVLKLHHQWLSQVCTNIAALIAHSYNVFTFSDLFKRHRNNFSDTYFHISLFTKFIKNVIDLKFKFHLTFE